MSGLLSGLATLAHRREISLSVDFMDHAVEVPYSAMELILTRPVPGATRSIVFEFYDRADKVIPSALEFADLYFKRQYGPETRALGQPALGKIRPLGLTIAGFSRSAWRLVLAGIYASLRRKGRPPAGRAASLRQAMADARTWMLTSPPDALLVTPAGGKEPRIVFQPRLWDTSPGSGDAFDLANEDRVAIVRALRTSFPEERAIGLVHSPAALRLAPDLQLSAHTTMEQHHQQLRASAVAVNCVGLSGSIGWKFAEYLAAGNAIVSHPLEKEFLAPVEPGVHYLPYRTPEECVEQCRRLLADPAMAARMGEVNRAYYRKWIDPPAHARHLLTRAFA